MSQGPLHQPPSSDDLRQHPPANAACARMRGLMRDFVDSELDSATTLAVEEHVHGCRACALGLARAEHEWMQVRRLFPRRQESAPVGFSAAVVARLLREEPDFAAPEFVGPASDEGEAVGAAAVESVRGRGRRRAARAMRLLVSMPGVLMLGVLLLAGLVVFQGLRLGDDGMPEVMARLVITDSVQAFADSGEPLQAPYGLSDDQLVYVGADGAAAASWHDKSDGAQPAATFQLGSNAAVRLHNGEPVLVHGKLRIEARRPFGLSVDGRSRLELGVGEYILTADSSTSHWDPAAGAPDDLRIGVEVVHGDDARFLRQGQAPISVGPGAIGIYADGSILVQTISDPDGTLRGDVPMPPGAPVGSFSGRVLERSSLPVSGADVLISYLGNGAMRSWPTTAGGAGFFQFATGAPGAPPLCDSRFAVLQVLPPANRPDLGLAVPEAYSLTRLSGHDVQLDQPVVLDAGVAFAGFVVEGGQPVSGARLVPCVVDELFGCVLPWRDGLATTNSSGGFRIRGLPGRLPPHQRLVVVLSHPDFETTVHPVPVNGGPAVFEYAGRCATVPLRSIRLQSLPVSTTVEIWQDVPGLPPGSAARILSADTDADGRVGSLMVGTGRLFLRTSSPLGRNLRELVMAAPQAVPTYQPANGAVQEFETIFHLPLMLPGLDLAFAGNYRYQNVHVPTVPTTPWAAAPTRHSIFLTNALTAGFISSAQVFALQSGGPRGLPTVRFLGFSSATGVLVYDRMPGDVGLFAIAANGAVGSLEVTQVLANQGLLAVAATGAVEVDPALRPPIGQPRVLVLEFERMGPGLGLNQRFVRFASDVSGWEVGGLPAGTYHVAVNGLVVEGVEVTPNGIALLR